MRYSGPRCVILIFFGIMTTLLFGNLLAFNRLQSSTSSSPSVSVVIVANDVSDSNILKEKLSSVSNIVQIAQQHINSNKQQQQQQQQQQEEGDQEPDQQQQPSGNQQWFSYFDKIKFGLQRQKHHAANQELPDGEDNPTLAVRWYGPFWSGGGYSSEAISFVTSIKYITPLQVFHMGDMYREEFIKGMDSTVVSEIRMMEQTFIEASKSVSICHTPPREWFATSDDQNHRVRCPPEGAAYTIGRTMFETDGIPRSWVERLNRMDAVWVPSHFNFNTFVKAGVNETRIHIVPESVDTSFYDPNMAKPSTYIIRKNNRQYIFLSVFKWEERKGWRFLIEAYLSEFSLRDNVVLYILSDQEVNSPKLQQQMTRHFIKMGYDENRIAKLAEIRFLHRGISEYELRDLYNAVDAFVLPSRGEGWGRPHVEAMSMGLPVIATAWSGPQEFLNEQNGYPLSIDGLEIISEPLFFKGFRWATPSIKHLRQLMRHVYTNRDEARSKGQQARLDMKEHYCPACVAKLVVKELRRIETLLRLKPQFSPSFSLHSDNIVS